MSNPAVFTYGRFNPPTIGHEQMIVDMIKYAKEKGATPYVIVSHSYNSSKNPLKVNNKLDVLQKMFPDDNEVKFLYTLPALMMLKDIPAMLESGYGHDSVEMVVGSDRVGQFNWLGIPVLSLSKKRNQGRSRKGVHTVSGTRVREAACSDDPGSDQYFRNCMSPSLPNNEKARIKSLVRNRMKARS
tara:strand:+ start:64 stop:621 length:558 start_codon:yes stop_codon:yes gene_type:complete